MTLVGRECGGGRAARATFDLDVTRLLLGLTESSPHTPPCIPPLPKHTAQVVEPAKQPEVVLQAATAAAVATSAAVDDVIIAGAVAPAPAPTSAPEPASEAGNLEEPKKLSKSGCLDVH